MIIKLIQTIFFSYVFFFISINIFSKNIVVTNLSDSGPASLRDAILIAEDGDKIIFNIPDISSSIIQLDSVLTINKSLQFVGINIANGDTIIILQNSPFDRVIEIEQSVDGQRKCVLFNNLKFKNGKNGGINVNINNDVQFHNCTIADNSNNGEKFGGLFLANNTFLLMNNCIVKGNSGTYAGGVFGDNATLQIFNSNFYGNISSFDGGGITIKGGELTIEDSNISSNILSGIHLIDAKLNMKRCIVNNNGYTGSGYGGGGIAGLKDTDMIIEDSSITNNVSGDGGGILSFSNLYLKKVNILNNRGTSQGGGINFGGKELRMDSCDISYNKGFNGGGGIYIVTGGKIEITNTYITENESTNTYSDYSGGGILSFSPLIILNSTICNNKATLGAGLHYLSNNKQGLIVRNCTFFNNTATKKGGGIYIQLFCDTILDQYIHLSSFPEAELVNNTISSNSAELGGGVYYEGDVLFSEDHAGTAKLFFYNNLLTFNEGNDFVEINRNNVSTTYNGKSNIGLYKSFSENMNIEFTSYTVSSLIFRNGSPILANNGGFTKTLALDDRSIAKNMGVGRDIYANIPLNDQRGIERVDFPCVGSFELSGSDILPVITTEPVDNSVYVRETVVFITRAEGQNLNYQWFKNNQIIPNANTESLFITNVSSSDSGDYYCKIKNFRGEVNSKTVKLTVLLVDAKITTQPIDIKTKKENTIQFELKATGDELFYQWYKNDILINEATNNVFQIEKVQLEDMGNYYCIVKNTTSQEQSSIVKLIVYDEASLGFFIVNNEEWNIVEPYILDCDDDGPMQISISPEMEGSRVYYNGEELLHNKLTLNIERPSTKVLSFEIVSKDGSIKRSYSFSIQKKFKFEDLVISRWNNTLIINNNSSSNGGYDFVHFKWYKNNELVGERQFYSAGPNTTDFLETNAEYYVEVKTLNGEILKTCPGKIEFNNNLVSIYPTILGKNELLHVKIVTDEVLGNVFVEVFNISGQKVDGFKEIKKDIEFMSPPNSGIYIIRVYSGNTELITKKILVK